jgi:hypothetical protein
VQMYVMLQPSQLPKGQVYGQVSLPWGVEGWRVVYHQHKKYMI